MKTTITAYISIEADKIRKEKMKKEGNGWFSNWLDMKIKELNNLETLEQEERKKMEELKEIQEKKKLISTPKLEINLSITQIAELREAKKIISKDNSMLKGRISKFNNDFGKEINKEQYIKLLESV